MRGIAGTGESRPGKARARCALISIVGMFAALPAPATAATSVFEMRGKWFTAAVSLPRGDALRQGAGDAALVDHNADLRLMWRRDSGPLRVVVAHSTTALGGDSTRLRTGSGLVFEQAPTDGGNRLFDLTWQLAESGDARLLHRFDRLAIAYRTPRWGVTVGRQAVSWGAGLVFRPLDLLSPFAPTTVDQDYKAGDDLVLVERLFESGADLQVLAVGRRGGRDGNAASVAAKFRGHAGDVEFEVMGARHRGEKVFGAGWRAPLGGALVRADIVAATYDGGTAVSGILNADYSVAAFGTVLHLFGEYHRNGFGVRRLPAVGRTLPKPLRERLARGETFTRMRDYLAVGASFRWHFLVQQSASVIANLHDGSGVLQAAVTVDASDAGRVQAGFAKPFGDVGDEFGRVVVADGLTTGGGSQAFVRVVHYF